MKSFNCEWSNYKHVKFKKKDYIDKDISIEIDNDSDYLIRTKKYKLLDLKDNEKIIIQLWLNDYTDLYNKTIKFLKSRLKVHNYNKDKNKKYLLKNSWRYIRTNKILDIFNDISKINNMNKHTLQLAIQDACAMFKSAISNYENKIVKRNKCFDYYDKDKSLTEIERQDKKNKYKPINFPNMKEIKKTKQKKTMSIPKDAIFDDPRYSGMFPSLFKNKEMKLKDTYSKNEYLKLNTYKVFYDFKLQYNKKTNEYHLFIPSDKKLKDIKNRIEKCGIDPGIRTFLTIYHNDSREEREGIIELGYKNNIKKTLIPYFERIDRANDLRQKKVINKQKYHKILDINYSKIKNIIKDLHYKTANYLCKSFDIIHFGKISTKSIKISKNTHPIVKRIINQLSFHKFMRHLEYKAEEYKTKLIFINEHLTTQMCHKCGTLNKNIGDNKDYLCINNDCYYNFYSIDRDTNSAINIYNKTK